MKFTLLGSLGHISKPLAEILIKAGHEVTVISSDLSKKSSIESMGAKAAIGSISDSDFLTKTFEGADAVYTMVPPNFSAANYRQYIAETAKVYVNAIIKSGIKKIVNLSSIGAHLDKGTGPIAGLHDLEVLFEGLENVAVKHLRAGFFYTNFFNDIPLIKNAGILGNNYSGNTTVVMVHPRDIAAAAAAELQQSFSGKSYRYIISDEGVLNDIVKVLGSAIGKPSLPWVEFSDADAFGGMTGAGLPIPIAETFVEMGTAVRNGKLFEDYLLKKPVQFGSIKISEFAKEFALAYSN